MDSSHSQSADTKTPGRGQVAPDSEHHGSLRQTFRSCSQSIAQATGSPWAAVLAFGVVIAWAILGQTFHYSDAWQLVINTATNVITFLMVFLIQNTQNRDTKAIQLKLDELLRGLEGARTSFVNLESLSDDELDRLQREFERVRGRAQRQEQSASRKAA